jgi:PTS system ascorbate-specific IIC component
MDLFLNTFRVIAGQIELVMGIVVLIGLLIQKKKGYDIVKGVFKAVIGVLILKQGAGLLQAAYRPVMEMINEAFGITGIVTENYAGMAAINTAFSEQILGMIPQVMVLGFLINLVLARFSNLKYVFLTAHTMLAFSTLSVWLVHFFFGAEGLTLLLVSGIICGLYWTIMPAWVHKYAEPFVGDSFTLGHISGFAAIISSRIGRIFGKYDEDNPKLYDEADDSPDEGKFSFFSKLFSDSTVVTAILMTVVLTGASLIVPFELVVEKAGAVNPYVYLVLLGSNFTVGIVILLTGVRMMIAELVPAFKGISDKLIPDSVPALDMPVFYPLAPFASILGFIGAFIGEFIGFLVLLLSGYKIVMIPGIIATFFDGGVAGVFGYKYGGRKSAFISGIVVGLVQILGGVIFTGLSGLATLGATYGNTDFGILWPIITFIMSILGNAWLFSLVLVGLFLVANYYLNPKRRKA